MSEKIPRWGLPDVSFLETDTVAVRDSIIKTYEGLAGRVLADADPVRLFLLAMADVIIQLRTEVNIAARQNLISYAQGTYLESLGILFNVERLPASHAKTTMLFTLSQKLGQSFVIPKGFETTNGEVTFATDAELVISAGSLSASASASCVEEGETGNGYESGMISTIVSPMAYLKSARNTTTTSGGSDAESDAELADRIRRASNSFSVAGPKKAYEFHTFSVSSSIIDVAVTSPSAGVVNVYPLVEGGSIPSSELIGEISSYLSGDTIRPLTDELHVLAPTAYAYDIAIDYYISNDDKPKANEIRKSVTEAVESYRKWQQSKVGRDITPEKLVQLVMQAGASHIYSGSMSPASYVTLQPSQVAQCGSVAVRFAGYRDL